MRRIPLHLVAIVWVGSTAASVAAAEDVTFVAEGVETSVRQIGGQWTAGKGFLQCGGENNYLAAGKALGAGDFHIRARLSLAKLDGTAATLVIGGNHFGFDGSGKKIFVEGPAFGPTQLLDDAGKLITPGKPFDVEVARKDATLSFRIDGKEIHKGVYKLGPVCAIGLRPWRATMRLYEFSAGGNMTPVTEAAIAAMQQPKKRVAQPASTG